MRILPGQRAGLRTGRPETSVEGVSQLPLLTLAERERDKSV